MRPEKQFGKNLREARLRQGFSQEHLAELCRLHATGMSRLERAVPEPRLSTIVRLARALQIEPAELLDGIS